MAESRYRTCRKCGGTFREEGFRRYERTKYTWSKRARHSICRICEVTARTKASHENPALAKARNALNSHIVRLLRQRVITNKDELQDRYGWSIKQMAHDIDHASHNGCPYCHRPFAEMMHGMADITLDIVDPAKPPYYRTNVRWVCRTCNTEKRRTPPEEYAAYREYSDEYREWQRRKTRDEWAGTIFEGTQREQLRLL